MPAPAAAAQATVANRCFTATGHRLAASIFLLLAAVVTLCGAALRRDRHSLPSAGEGRPAAGAGNFPG